ncbi:hypothetical protein RD055328_01460 [Companilactobacillus sp. RD055328]|uniref:hypothetical protein n=1 Tax=Companilactobacillus sp. RD055328 TaxID=2916634 RepID=UPI001FC87DC4|nr:hypothetical protein [Companilactobacillus sp. RD055328]GKQ42223.1 hypothetical protein RD055328_01460 [Companilactobacillus sp. RD055328]
MIKISTNDILIPKKLLVFIDINNGTRTWCELHAEKKYIIRSIAEEFLEIQLYGHLGKKDSLNIPTWLFNNDNFYIIR